MTNFLSILLYGSIWGIVESTLGYILHLTPFHIGSLIWIPLATFFMMRVYKATGKKSSIFYIALLSATIKLLNLFLPGSIDKVINPAISILLEGISFMVVVILMEGKNIKNPLCILTFNSLWRVLYLTYIICSPTFIFEKSALVSIDSYINFILVSNLKTCVTTWLFLIAEDKINYSINKIKPAYICALLAVNVVCSLTF